jgi:DivIVA domain-containing protein
MIDLTPLDVRSKRGDFKKLLRGYDPEEVDVFLEMVADRLEALVRENIQLRDRTESLHEQVVAWSGREKAVQEALVTAQELRTEMRKLAQQQADMVLADAQAEARRQLAEAQAEIRTRFRDAERRLAAAQDALDELERRRIRFLKSYRQLLEREMDVVEVEVGRPPLEERSFDLDLGGGAPPGESESAALTGYADGDVVPDADATLDDLAADFRREGTSLFDTEPGAPDEGFRRG